MTVAAFADSSALVKLYADEPGAEAVRALPLLVVSQLARVEVPAALWRKHRVGALSETATGGLVAAFEDDYLGTDEDMPRFSVIVVTAGILDRAARLVGAHGLRAYDAVQVASACALAEAAPDEGVVFAAFDKTLRVAAAAEGLGLLAE